MAVVNNYTALLPRNPETWTGGPVGQATFLTYSFSAAPSPDTSGATAASFQPLNEVEKAIVRAALQKWSNASEVTFQETRATEGDLTFGFYDLATLGYSTSAAVGWYPGSGLSTDSSGRPHVNPNVSGVGGSVAFDSQYRATPGFAAELPYIALHEIGHALGLKHPFDYTGDTLLPSLDTSSATVMSYTGSRANPALGPLDVLAIQYLYGVRGQDRPWGLAWNAATESLVEVGTAAAQGMRGTNGPDVIRSGGGRDAISAGGGNDIIYAAGVPIEIDGGAGFDTVYTGVTFTAGMSLNGSGTWRSLYLLAAGDSQQFWNVESFQFNNGEYLTDADRFAYRDQPGSQAYVSFTGRDLLVLDEGRRGSTFTVSGGTVTFQHNGQADTLRGLADVRFVDGRMVFSSSDPAAAVTRLYKAALGRLPDQAGLNFWIGQLQGGAPLQRLAEVFLGTAEYAARFGGSNADFVLQAYNNVLGRAPDAGGAAFWTGSLDSGRTTRSAALAFISESTENKAATAALLAAGIWDRDETAAQVARLYDTGLGRAPDQGGLANWMADIRGGRTLQDVAGNIARSAEFRAAYDPLGSRGFVEALYRNTLGRAGDATGVDYWTAALDGGGATRTGVLLGFSESGEHQVRTAATITPDTPATYGILLA